MNVVTLLASGPSDSTFKGGLAEDESRRNGKLQNSDVLQNLEGKLSHLPKEEKKAVMELIRKFVLLFPDVPGKTTCACHDVDVGNAQPISSTLTESTPLSWLH